MTTLERFAAAVLAQWQSDGGAATTPMSVGTVLDRTFPYRIARKMLGIDVSEDYEAFMLRLIAQEENLVRTEPAGAAELARSTMASKLPDLDALKLVRSAHLTFTDAALARLEGVLSFPAPKDDPKWAAEREAESVRARAAVDEVAEESARPTANDMTPRTRGKTTSPSRGRTSKGTPEMEPPPPPADDVIPLPVPQAPPPQSGPPADYLTSVAFTAPGTEKCWSCGEGLPVRRTLNFCPHCGSDQRQPACTSCGAAVERKWKHCPECGVKLWDRGGTS